MHLLQMLGLVFQNKDCSDALCFSYKKLTFMV